MNKIIEKIKQWQSKFTYYLMTEANEILCDDDWII